MDGLGGVKREMGRVKEVREGGKGKRKVGWGYGERGLGFGKRVGLYGGLWSGGVFERGLGGENFG